MTSGWQPAFEPAGAEDPAFESYADACEQALRTILAGTQAHEAVAAAAALSRHMDGPALRAAALHPMLRHWRARLAVKTASGSPESAEEWAQHLPRLLLGPALAAARELGPVRVPLLPGGQLRLPGLPRHLDLGQHSGGTVLLRRHGDELLITHQDRTRAHPVASLLSGGRPFAEHPVLPGTGIELDATDPWVVESITQASAQSDSPLYRPRDLAPADAIEHQDLFGQATRLIGRAWPGCLAELARHVRLVVPLSSEVLSGWTAVSQLGAIYIRPGGMQVDDLDRDAGAAGGAAGGDPVMFTAECIVHEAAHTRLQVLSLGQPLFAGRGQHQPLRSPLRKDVRPAYGVYHAAFVLARVVVFLCRAAEATGASHYLARADQNHRDLKQASGQLIAHASLSPAGRELLDEAIAAADTASAGIRTASEHMS
jgi:HEXXH motif-containing protein